MGMRYRLVTREWTAWEETWNGRQRERHTTGQMVEPSVGQTIGLLVCLCAAIGGVVAFVVGQIEWVIYAGPFALLAIPATVICCIGALSLMLLPDIHIERIPPDAEADN